MPTQITASLVLPFTPTNKEIEILTMRENSRQVVSLVKKVQDHNKQERLQLIQRIEVLKKEQISADDLHDAGWNGAINEVLKLIRKERG